MLYEYVVAECCGCGVLYEVIMALSCAGVNLLIGTESGLQLLDRSGQGKGQSLLVVMSRSL